MLPQEQQEQQEPTQRELYQKVVQKLSAPITSEEKARLEALKLQDPDAWRQELNAHDAAFQNQKMKEYDTALTRETQARQQLTLKEQQEAKLNEFNTKHQIAITDDMLEFDVPARLKAKFDDHLSEEYLTAAKDYLTTAKVLDASVPPDSLGGVPPVNGAEITTTNSDDYSDFGA